jgi:hypothetical protein
MRSKYIRKYNPDGGSLRIQSFLSKGFLDSLELANQSAATFTSWKSMLHLNIPSSLQQLLYLVIKVKFKSITTISCVMSVTTSMKSDSMSNSQHLG